MGNNLQATATIKNPGRTLSIHNTPAKQNYVVYTILKPTVHQDIAGFKIYGVTETITQAAELAHLYASTTNTDIFIAEMGHWVPLDLMHNIIGKYDIEVLLKENMRSYLKQH